MHLDLVPSSSRTRYDERARRRSGGRRPSPAPRRSPVRCANASASGRSTASASRCAARRRRRARAPRACVDAADRDDRTRPPSTLAGTSVARPMNSATARDAGRVVQLLRRARPAAAGRSRISATRSATANASSWSCVTNSAVTSEPAQRGAQLVARALAQRRIEVGQRLVEQQHARLDHQRARQRDALLLAARQRLHRRARLRRRARRSRAPRRARASRSRLPHAARLEPERDVLLHASCAGRARSAGTPSRSRAAAAARAVMSRRRRASTRPASGVS